MGPRERWCQVRVLGPDGAELASELLGGEGRPDLGTLDHLARLGLQAGRLGGRLVLAQVSPALRALLDLAALPVEVEGQPEPGEEPLGVEDGQEEQHPRDLPP